MRNTAKLFLLLFVLSFFQYGKDARAADIDTNKFYGNPILTCPTDNSVTLRIVSKSVFQIYYEYGMTPNNYTNSTAVLTSTAGIPVQFILNGLNSNTRYYYRLRYKAPGDPSYTAGDMHTFITHRPRGSTFTFTINGDSHLYDRKGVPSVMRQTMSNILRHNPDFHFELGDTYGDDRNPSLIDSAAEMRLKLAFIPYESLLAHSCFYFFVLGNHEGENAWYINQPQNLYLYGTLSRKFYYAMPEPNGFYSGNDFSEGNGMGKPQNYYSFEWGDALFVVLDDYRYCTSDALPGAWNWTLGQQQYNWLRQTLQNSTAKYKFVFAHHAMGYGRGGIIMANQFEWGDTVHFNQNRPGWGGVPVHQLMAQNHVTVFFQGHDHLFATEQANGVYYQEVGMPSDSTYQIGWLANSDAYSGPNKFDGSGYVRVTVGPVTGKVEYVSTYLAADTGTAQHNDSVRFSYTILPYTYVREISTAVPDNYVLSQNFPNPFNPSTVIRYGLKESSFVKLTVYDIRGREIETLVNTHQREGVYEATFSADEYPSGIYFYTLTTDNYRETKKMALLK